MERPKFCVASLLSTARERDAVTFLLESQVMASVLECRTSGDVLDLLLRDTPIHLLVVEYPGSAEPILKFLASRPERLPVVIISKESKTPISADHPMFAKIDLRAILGVPIALEELQKIVKSASDDFEVKNPPTIGSGLPGQPAAVDGEDGDYVRVRVEVLSSLGALPTDAFLKLGKSKYIKMFLVGDSFEKEDHKKFLLEKKVEFLYVLRADSEKILPAIKESLLKGIREAETKTPEVLNEMLCKAHECAQELYLKMGMTAAAKEIIRHTMISSVKAMGSTPRLKQILAKITADKSKFLSSHSMALAQLACTISSAMEWGSTATFHKLTLAALLHDFSLPIDDPAFACNMERLKTKDEIMAKGRDLTPEQVKRYLLHPVESASLAQQLDEVPPDVDSIILHHHERSDGKGFPRGINHQHLPPIASVFILAHEMVMDLIENPKEFTIDKFLAANRTRLQVGQFRKILAAIEKAAQEAE